MKALLINGSPNECGCTYTALNEVSDTLYQRGVNAETLYFGKKKICAFLNRLSYSSGGRMAADWRRRWFPAGEGASAAEI